MRALEAVAKVGVADAIAKGTRPVCNALREFQATLVETARAEDASHLCNDHAGALAKSSPADIAGEILLKLIQLWRRHAAGPAFGCDFCQGMRSEEQTRLPELAEQLSTRAIAELLQKRGAISLAHGKELASRLPSPMHPVLARVISRTARDLDEDLRGNAQECQQIGGGILGHVAEFPVSQRAVSHQETPCSNRDQQKR